jgi:hypothetical protein
MRIFKALLVVSMVAFQAMPLQAANDAQAQLELIAQKKAELNNHEWDVKMTPSSGKGDATSDVLVFKGQQFESKNMTSKGYKPTNYTVSLQEGGPTVWETMQSTDSGNPVFWRGEWEGESMRGVMSKQVGEGKNEDYYFSSTASKAIQEEVKPVVEAVQEAAADVKEAAEEGAAKVEEAAVKAEEKLAELPVQEEQPKKKKGWF